MSRGNKDDDVKNPQSVTSNSAPFKTAFPLEK